jgi:3-hydroxybutyryl-CoA dehydratase
MLAMMQSAKQLTFDEIQLGDTVEHEINVLPEMVNQFIDISQDRSPIHVDEAIAKARGFSHIIVPGLLVSSLVSGVIGMDLPGEYGLLHEVNFKYKSPVYIGDTLKIQVSVKEKIENFKLVRLSVYIKNQQDKTVCRGTLTSGISQ